MLVFGKRFLLQSHPLHGNIKRKGRGSLFFRWMQVRCTKELVGLVTFSLQYLRMWQRKLLFRPQAFARPVDVVSAVLYSVECRKMRCFHQYQNIIRPLRRSLLSIMFALISKMDTYFRLHYLFPVRNYNDYSVVSSTLKVRIGLFFLNMKKQNRVQTFFQCCSCFTLDKSSKVVFVNLLIHTYWTTPSSHI